MYQASEQFNTDILGDNRTFRAKLKSGGTEITSGIISIKQYAQSASETITIGGAMSAYAEIQMWKPDVQLEGNEVEISIGLIVDGALEYVPLGLYTVQKPEDDDGVIRFVGYDRIQSKMGGAYFSELAYPADGKSVLAEISSKTGVPIDTSSLPDGIMISQRAVVSEAGVDDDGNEITSTTYTNPFDGYTYREALGYIAMLYCKFATVDRAGTVVFRWYVDSSYTIGSNRYYDDLVTAETVFTVGAISCSVGDTVLTAGSGTETIQLENPVMTQERLDAIYESIKSMQFLPAGLSFYGDLKPELGDIVTVNDKYGNIVRIPVMSITQEFDGGLLTKIQSFGGTEQESSDTKGPTAKKMDRVYTDLFLVKELIGSKADFDYVHGKFGEFETMKATVAEINSAYINMAQVNTLLANYAKIDLANITAGSIKTAMIDIGAVNTAQIADGAITDAKIVNLTANKITAGTLSVERLEIRGSTNSIVYALNNITGALQAQNVYTLNGEILTPRSITADRIVANSITGNEIAAKTITANNIVANSITGDEIAAGSIKAVNIDVTNLFAQDITANGKIRGVTMIGGSITTESDLRGKVQITNGGIIQSGKTYLIDGSYVNTSLDIVQGRLDVHTGLGDDDSYYGVQINGERFTIYENHVGWVNADSKSKEFHVSGSIVTTEDITERGLILSDKYAALSHTHSYLPLAGGTMTGNLSVPSVYASSWFRSTGDTGWYNETYGGGIYMDNDEYVKVYNGKNFHCDALISTGSEFRSVRSGYDYDWRFGAGCGTGDGAKFGFYNNQQGLVASFDPSKFNVLNKEIVSDNPNGICQFRAVNGNYGFMIRNDGTKTYFLVTDSGNAYGFWTTSFTPFSIDNQTGEVTIGTDAVFNSEIRSNGNINAKTVSTYSGNHKPLGSIDTDGQRVSGFGGASTTVLKVWSQWGTAGASYSSKNISVSSSDVRLKANILDTDVHALDVIKEIRVRQFDWIDHAEHQRIGFVADELEIIDSKFAIGGGYNDDGSMDTKSVDDFYMLGYVVKGMQEICTIDAEQDIRLAELDRKYMSHDAQIESLQQQLIDARQQIAEQASEIAQLRSMISVA